MNENNGNIKTDLINQILFDIENKCELSVKDINIIKTTFFLTLEKYDIFPKKHEIMVSERTNEILWKKFFLTKKAENLSERTLRYYKLTLESFSWEIKKRLLDITSDDIRFYLIKKEQEKCTEVTLDNLRRNLSSFFRWLQDEGIRHDNPVARIKRVRGETSEQKAFTNVEIEKIRNACKNSFEKALIELLLSTAARLAELTNIKIKDIDFDKNEIKVIRKGNKIGYIYLNAKANIALHEYINSRKQYNSEFLWVRQETGINILEAGTRYSADYLSNHIKAIGKRAGIEHVHPHKFRRTVATLALQKGMTLEEVQQILGHSQINTTLRYTKIDRSDIRMKHNRIID